MRSLFCPRAFARENPTDSQVARGSGWPGQRARDTHDLAHDIGVNGAADRLRFGESLGIDIHYQPAVFDGATHGEIGAVTLLQEVERLGPDRDLRESSRPLASAIDESEKGASQRRMQRFGFDAQPENIPQGELCQAG